FHSGEAVAVKDLFVTLISQLGVSDGDAPGQRLQALLIALAGGLIDRLLQLLVNGCVYAADEEARHRRDAFDRLAFIEPAFEAANVGFHGRLIATDRKQQGDVDVDAFAKALLDGRYAFGGGGNLDHHVRARDQPPQAPR